MAGVYIKNMEKPRKCIRCPFALWGHCAANNDKDIEKIVADAQIDKDCPLIEVPEHGRLVEADAVVEQICEWIDGVGYATVGKGLSYYGELLGCIEDAPTILPADKEG